MAKYLDKWKDLFPDTVGGTTRPSEAVSDQEEFNTDGFPQFIAQDPVNYALQNAFLKQFLSNDAWLWVKQKQANQALDDHKVDTQAHAKGISGNAGSATKLANARTINLSGAVTADAVSFDGTADATINVKTLDASKLKGTASVSTTGNAGSATKVIANAADGASANIAEATMASNDLARIRVSGEANAGELALETADDGSEPIVARQYTGAYTTPVRTAKILDESGNTSFPGTVVAPKFTGTLNGNAATATKLQTPRTLSLSGKAAGSATFDGAANAAINVTSVNADTASKLSTARKINITGNATGSAAFDGTSDVSINTTVNESKHAAAADTLKSSAATETSTVARPVWLSWEGDNTKQTVSPNLTYTCSTKTLTATNFAGHLAGNADSATKAINDVDGANIASTYLKKSGGNMNGPLNFANATWNLVGDDSYMGDHDISGTFCVKGANGETGIALVNKGNENDYARISYGGGNINFNKKIAANLAGNADTSTKASVADVVHKAIQPCGVWANENYIFYGTLTIPQNGVFFKLEVLGGSGYNSNIDQSREGTLYFRTGNNAPAHYAAYSEYHRNGAKELKFFVVKDSGTRYRIYSGLTFWTGNMQVIPYITQDSSFDLALTTVSALPDGAVEVEQQQLIYASTVNNYAPTKTGGGASGTWGINISGNADTVDGYHASDLLSKIYPVGSIYMSMSATNPHDLFGVGTWKRISQGRMLLGADDRTYKAGATGGEATHTLTAAEMPAHSHGISTSGDHSHYFYGSDNNNGPLTEGDGLDTEANGHFTRNVRFTTSSSGAHTHTISNSGGGAAHNNMSPYLVCYIWQRTA